MSNATASIDMSTVNLYYKDELLSIKKITMQKKTAENFEFYAVFFNYIDLFNVST